MRYIWFAALALFSLCCAPNRPPLSQDRITEASADTVALMVARDDGSGYRPLCAGVWVSEEWILTANHCVMDDTDGIELPVATMHYISDRDSDVVYQERDSDVVYRDVEHDLALLRAKTWPVHRFAPVASASPRVGTELHVFGHPLGFLWTYTTASVAAVNVTDPRLSGGPYLILQGAATHGNSGGGAFDNQGRLVGICDRSASGWPTVGFFIPVEVIVPFLKKSHVL